MHHKCGIQYHRATPDPTNDPFRQDLGLYEGPAPVYLLPTMAPLDGLLDSVVGMWIKVSCI
jgi:hypothetical protein